ncbi:transcriptional regulator [Chitinophaga caeni]|uniref:Transcriptional regulator n=2 Tax=Chitinophaga caeni TaxID=2029983 RepID=A0A291QWA9_9BACT|nr:transcriptional regulator [Chitinophaga caeni]
MLLPKQKNISRLGKHISTSGDIIGRYERDAMMPSIEVIIKIADMLDISIDNLVSKSDLVLDQATFKRLEDINALPPEAKEYVLGHIEIMIRDFKNKVSGANVFKNLCNPSLHR